jgi:CheY-like chemotaxis protein
MPRLFFDLHDGTTQYADTVGTDLADLAMVRSEAVRFLATVFKDTAPDGGSRAFVVKVRDSKDQVIFTTGLTLQENWIESAGMETANAAQFVVLVVEDDRLARVHAVDLIEEAGFRVVEARGAEEAIAILESRQDISVVFTDIVMPGAMDGLQLARYIRGNWPPIKIIATSGGFVIRDDELPEGGVFLPKPYTADGVTSVLRDFTS